MSDLDELELRPTRKKKTKGVRLDFSNPEALQESRERFYGQYSPDALKAKVMPLTTKYYYVYGITKEGKAVSLGPFWTAQDADQELAHLDDGEIFELKTKDLTKATRIVKAEMMRRGKEPDKALKKLSHRR